MISVIANNVQNAWKTILHAVFQAVATLGPHRGKADYDSSAFPFRTDRNRSILNCWGLHTTSHCKYHYYPVHMKVYSFPTIHCTIFSQGQHQLVSCSSCECTYTHTHTQKNSSFASFNKANIVLYFVWTGSYQAILLCSIIFCIKFI